MLERLVSHHRSEIRAANADVYHVPNALAGVPLPGAAADAVGQIGHLIEHGVDLGYDVLPINGDGCTFRRAQGHVQHGASFRNVDFFASNIASIRARRSDFIGQLDEEFKSFVGDAIL